MLFSSFLNKLFKNESLFSIEPQKNGFHKETALKLYTEGRLRGALCI